MLGIILQFSVQMTGVSFLQYYGPTIYGKVGYSTVTTLLLGAANSILGLITQFTVCAWIDKLGRRRPLIIANSEFLVYCSPADTFSSVRQFLYWCDDYQQEVLGQPGNGNHGEFGVGDVLGTSPY